MAFASVTDTAIPSGQVAQQKSGAVSKAEEAKDAAAEENKVSTQTGDKVTLSQAGKGSDVSVVMDKSEVGKALPRTMSAILADSKSAIASQANVDNQTAREMLA